VNRVFVSGGTGFIGQRLLVKIKERGDSLKIISRQNDTEYEAVRCDLQSEVIPDDILRGVDTAIHLAGFAHDLSYASKKEYLYRVMNVDVTVRLAELAVVSGVKRFVFVSSIKAGGIAVSGKCLTEEDQCEPEGIYGKTKRDAELKVLEIGRQSGMHVSIVRPSLVYGPGVKGNLALMQSGIKAGWFPPLPETGNRRSMIHVDDLVQALLLVAEDSRANGEIFIATDGVPHSSREIYESICHGAGKPIPNWSIPKFLFNAIAKLSPKLMYKMDKLMGDEYYSSEKLEKLGFRAERTLKDWNFC
jgi:UDP-glucose 4-epimerase